jgi:hypothetical protein
MDVIFTDQGQLLTKETSNMMFGFIKHISFMTIHILLSAVQKVMMHPSDWLLEGADITFVSTVRPWREATSRVQTYKFALQQASW